MQDDDELYVSVETKIPAATRDIGKQVKRRWKVALASQYVRCALDQVRRDAQAPLGNRFSGAEPDRDRRLDPAPRFDDITVNLRLTETDYAAMKAAARSVGLTRPQYCRQAIVNHIASPLAEGRTQATPVDRNDYSEEASWLWLVTQ